MAEEFAFTHITVSSDEEDDVVIEAGATAPKQDARERAPRQVAPQQPAPQPASQPAPAPEPAPEKDAYRETTLEDIQGTKMSLVQKVIIALALLGIAAFVVWYVVL